MVRILAKRIIPAVFRRKGNLAGASVCRNFSYDARPQNNEPVTKIGLLSGASIVKSGIVQNMRSVDQQQQPCGVDLTFSRAFGWTSPAALDFDNSNRLAARTSELPVNGEGKIVKLSPGAYLIEFNETVHVPLDCMGQIFSRSSLWRSGAVLTAGVIDAGYRGALGALLHVMNPSGIDLCENAKLGQIVLHRLEEKVEGYSGFINLPRTALDGMAPS